MICSHLEGLSLKKHLITGMCLLRLICTCMMYDVLPETYIHHLQLKRVVDHLNHTCTCTCTPAKKG